MNRIATMEQTPDRVESPTLVRADGVRRRFSPWSLLLIAAGLSTVVGRSFTVVLPERDSYLFAYIGSQWLRGRIPYLNIWDNKPPGIYAINALVFSLFPNNFAALAVAEGVFILACAVAIYLLLRQWGMPREFAAFAAACACVACNLEGLNELGNYPEIYMLLPAALSMYWFTRSKQRFSPTEMFLAGAFAGLASLFKPTGLAVALAETVFLFYLTALRQIRLRVACRALVLGVAGAVSAWVPFCIYFWRAHALRAMLDAALIFPVKYGAGNQIHLLSEPLVIASRLLPMSSVVVCALTGLACFAVYVVRGEARESGPWSQLRFFGPLVILWIAFDSAGAAAGGLNFQHYFLALVPSLSVAAGLAAWFLCEVTLAGAPPVASRNLVFALILGPLLLSQGRDLLRIRNFYRGDLGFYPEDTINSTIEGLTYELDDAAAYINRTRRPGDTLFEWNYLPMLYYKTGMSAPTRTISAEPLRFFKQAHDQFGSEILQELEKTPPTYIVDLGPFDLVEHDWVYDAFHDYLRRSYVLVYTTHDRERQGLFTSELKVYRRIQPEREPGLLKP